MSTTQNSVSGPVNVVEEKRDLHQQVTDTIISQMEKGVAIWQKPWNGGDFNPFRIPMNIKTGNGYNGINILLLWSATISKDLKSHDWATFKQWNEKGEKIRKGESGSLIVKFDTFEKEVDGELKKLPFLKASKVFNRCQLASYVPSEPELSEAVNKVEKLKNVEKFISNTKAEIVHTGVFAKYNKLEDRIYMPEQTLFIESDDLSATEAYYSTLCHELAHWTGHEHRLNREFGKRFGNQTYAFEELIAELSSAFLMAELEITNTPKEAHASYLSNWLDVLKNDKKAIFTAASSATKATEYLKRLQTVNL